MIWHESLIPVVRSTSPNHAGSKPIAILDGNGDLALGFSPKGCRARLALSKGKVEAEENFEI